MWIEQAMKAERYERGYVCYMCQLETPSVIISEAIQIFCRTVGGPSDIQLCGFRFIRNVHSRTEIQSSERDYGLRIDLY